MSICKYGKVVCEGGKPVCVTDFICDGKTGPHEILTWAKQCIEEAIRNIRPPTIVAEINLKEDTNG